MDVCFQIKATFQETQIDFHIFVSPLVLPEYPVVLNRWGRQLNGTTLGPKEEVIV